MDKRVAQLFILLIYISFAQASIFQNFLNIFNHHVDTDISTRHKRITNDEGIVGLEHYALRNEEFGADNTVERRADDEDFKERVNIASDRKKSRSLSQDQNAGDTKILEQRATLRINDMKMKTRPKFENINSREEKEMSSIKTVSSVSVPAYQDGSGSGDDDVTLTEVSSWPAGRYGLPKSVTGCPTTIGFRWKTGFRYHDTEDDGTENQRSDVFHLAANFSEDGISHEFCIKDAIEGEGSWPVGKYCIYKRGPVCPEGLKDGFVIWDDENNDNQNDKGGTLPEGEYTEDTKIYFCCSTTGAVDNQISLPAKKPFFLFAYESMKCQKVLNMKSTSEFIKFDDEDHGNTDHEGGEYPYGIHKFQKDHMIFLCFYEPSKPVRSYVSTAMSSDGVEEQEGDELDQEDLRRGEEMMKAFMKATGGVEDPNNKRERTKTIIKTIKVPVRSKASPIATVVGLVIGSVVIGTVIILITKTVVHKSGSSKVRSQTHHLEASLVHSRAYERLPTKLQDKDMPYSEANDNSDTNSVSCVTASEQDSWSDLEEDNELVEDQLLPDSELKTGLELLFLKQQRHYWNQKKRSERHDHTY